MRAKASATQLSTTEDEAEYEAFLSGLDSALLYYSLPYKRFLENLLGCCASYWMVKERGRVTGILPIMQTAARGPRAVNSLPYFGSNGGVLATTAAAQSSLQRVFDDVAGEPEVVAATLVANPLDSGSAAGVRHHFTDARVGQFTMLAPAAEVEEKLSAQIDSSARRNVRKARRSGVRVSADDDTLEFLAQVHRENIAAIGGRAKSPRFFHELPHYFTAGRDYRIYRAEIDGEPVAALLLFYYNRTVEYFIPATRAEFRHTQPMALILYQAMVDAARRNYRRWNWGGTWTSQRGVYRFKRKWGAVDKPYGYYCRINDWRLMAETPGALNERFPDFYIVPFDKLDV